MFYAFEGMDGSGKTTLIRRVARALGEHTKVVYSPNETFERFRSRVRSSALDFPAFCFDYVQKLHRTITDQIQPALADGKIVLMDRSWLSMIADNILSLEDQQRFLAISESVIQRLPAFQLFYLDVKPEDAARRVFQRQLEAGQMTDYLPNLLVRSEQRKLRYDTFFESTGLTQIVLNASLSKDEVFERTLACVNR